MKKIQIDVYELYFTKQKFFPYKNNPIEIFNIFFDRLLAEFLTISSEIYYS